jgi:hypothetical protein
MKFARLALVALVLATFGTSPASAEATQEQIAQSVAKIVGRIADDWSWQTLEPLVHPMTRKPENFEPSLAKGRPLGALVKCTGTLEPLDNVPNAIKYRGQCEFEHGHAKVFVGFGVGKDSGEPVLIALGVFPQTPEQAAAAAPVAGADAPGATTVSGTVDSRAGKPEVAPADPATKP